MEQLRGILCLSEAPFWALQGEKNCVQRLIFSENEPLLSQAQEALWRLRRSCSWACVAAEGEAALVALALAVQLPVERLMLMGRWRAASRKMARVRSFALRNLPLMISDVILIGAGSGEVSILLNSRRYGRLCALEAQRWEACAELSVAPWELADEKNLLNSMKCV